MNESDIVRRAISKNKMITRLNPPQKNGCVSGRVNNVVAFYINRRKKPRLHYLLHVRGIGVNNEKWSEVHALELGGMHKLATKSHDACIAIEVNSLMEVEQLIDQFAKLSVYNH